MENYDKEVLDLAMEAGRILLDAGAEIFRVEETIQRIAKAFGIEKCSTFVLSTGIFITAENQEGQIYASVKHIPISGAKLHRIAAVNQLSREIVEGKYTVKEAEEKLEIIKHMPGKEGSCRCLPPEWVPAVSVIFWEAIWRTWRRLSFPAFFFMP